MRQSGWFWSRPIGGARDAAVRSRARPASPWGWARRTCAVGVAGLVVGLSVCGAAERGLPPSNGIGNFGKVNERLYRGAQPDAEGVRNLKRLGVRTIINLRMTNDVWRAEGAEASANGVLYTNAPLWGVGRPTAAQVRLVLGLIESLPPPVFIHCEHGCDRTGTIIACYRIEHDHWSGQAALDEARRFGMSGLERGMKRFVNRFAEERRAEEAKQTPPRKSL